MLLRSKQDIAALMTVVRTEMAKLDPALMFGVRTMSQFQSDRFHLRDGGEAWWGGSQSRPWSSMPSVRTYCGPPAGPAGVKGAWLIDWIIFIASNASLPLRPTGTSGVVEYIL